VIIMLAEGVTSAVGPVLLTAGAIVLVISLGRLMRRGGVRPGGRDWNEDAVRRIREAAEEEIARIELHARDTRAKIETKIHLLNALLVRSEKAIARLEEQETKGGGEGAPAEERFAEVYRLADGGLDAAGIASRTEFERGEVELILSLRAGGAGSREGQS
jgi:hypothetical protein